MLTERALQLAGIKQENRVLKSTLGGEKEAYGMIGRSPQMRQIYETIRATAPTEASVLIEGESGTGKELIATALHLQSPRQHAFTIHGHSWFHEAWVNNSDVLWRPNIDPEPDSMNIGSQGGHTARRHWNVILPSAGGGFSQVGDYLMRTQESFHFTSGLWGIFRVTPSKTMDNCLSCVPMTQ